MRRRRAVRSVKFSTPRRMRVYTPPLHRHCRHSTHRIILHSHTPKSVVAGAAAQVCCAKTWSEAVNEIKRKDLRRRDIHIIISYCTILYDVYGWCRGRGMRRRTLSLCVRAVCVCIYMSVHHDFGEMKYYSITTIISHAV